MEIELLDWDSRFFGYKTGSLFVDTQCNIWDILNKAKTSEYKLIYVFSSINNVVKMECLSAFNGVYVDTKVIYQNTFTETGKITSNYNIHEYSSSYNIEELYKLAIISGQFSRFNTDKGIGESKFIELYKQWIDGSINGRLADKIFIYSENKKIQGFVTIKRNNLTSKIGLIAVDSECQGKGVGKKLIYTVQEYLLDNKINQFEVVTQLENSQACRFYESLGMVLKEKYYTYHFWL